MMLDPIPNPESPKALKALSEEKNQMNIYLSQLARSMLLLALSFEFARRNQEWTLCGWAWLGADNSQTPFFCCRNWMSQPAGVTTYIFYLDFWFDDGGYMWVHASLVIVYKPKLCVWWPTKSNNYEIKPACSLCVLYGKSFVHIAQANCHLLLKSGRGPW